MTWTIVIPSYHRSESIKLNTLRVLEEQQIPKDRIKIFVSPGELTTYQQSLPGYEIIASCLGCIENRAFIRNYYPEGKHLVYIDDDINQIYSVCDFDTHETCYHYFKKNCKEPFYKKQQVLPSLSKFLDHAFQILQKEQAHFGGIYPVANGYFATHSYSTDLRYICGGFYLEINVKDFKLEGLQYSEDFERTCQWYIRDKKIVRFNQVLLKTPYYKGEGGLVETRTVELSKQAQESLHARYPELLQVVPPTKNNQYWNLKCKKQKPLPREE